MSRYFFFHLDDVNSFLCESQLIIGNDEHYRQNKCSHLCHWAKWQKIMWRETNRPRAIVFRSPCLKLELTSCPESCMNHLFMFCWSVNHLAHQRAPFCPCTTIGVVPMGKHDKDTEQENLFLSWGDDNCLIYAMLTLVRESGNHIRQLLWVPYKEDSNY